MTSASTEMIQVGALRMRFLVEAAYSNGSVSVFEWTQRRGYQFLAKSLPLEISGRVPCAETK
jgi:hypothetical protein